MNRKKLGALGEKLAKKFLRRSGYRIVTMNYQTRAGEIDIVARTKNSLVFVEVKTRSDTRHGYPELNVHPEKLRHFQNAVELYMLEQQEIRPYRLDVISVDMSGKRPEIRHFINITG